MRKYKFLVNGVGTNYEQDSDTINVVLIDLVSFRGVIDEIDHEETERAIARQGPRMSNRRSHLIMQQMERDFW